MLTLAGMGNAVEVTAATFETEVLDRSRRMPVVVDFWAAWCGPCRMIAPVIEKLAAELEGAVGFAKLDTDAEPEIAQRYGIRSLPTIKIFVGGEPVDEVIGAVPEPAIRALIERNAPSPAAEISGRAAAAFEAGDLEAASELWTEAVALDSEHSSARLGLARVALIRGEPAAALEALEPIGPVDDAADHAEALRSAARLLEEAADLDPGAGGAEALYAAGVRAFASGDYPGAMDNFLELVRTDRSFRDDAGRRGLLTVFGILGDAHPQVRDYRRKLMILT